MNDETLINLGTAAAAAITGLATYAAWRLRRRWLAALLVVIALIGTVVGCFLFWFTHRPLPTAIKTKIFSGITYNREILDGPVIVHILRIDLDAPGIRFMATPKQPVGDYVLSAKTTSQFLAEYQLQVAFNADYFDPWRDYGFFNYYPHVGEGVNVRGISVSEGSVYTTGYAPPENTETLYLTEDNHASFEAPNIPIFNAVSGNMMLLVNGEKTPVETDNDYLTGKHPRTAVALDISYQILIVILVDGRQPNYSEGVTIPELQAIIAANGGYDALNLDGGGSVTLAIAGETGVPIVLNSPIHNRIPGRERPIANHLGIFALPVGG